MCDYTEKLPALDFLPNVFVSLFSIEPCLPRYARYNLYEKVFVHYPEIRAALVSGFYYEDKIGQTKVKETGGIESYQTSGRFGGEVSEIFDETFITMRTPSKLFGDKVVEVWKILERK